MRTRKYINNWKNHIAGKTMKRTISNNDNNLNIKFIFFFDLP